MRGYMFRSKLGALVFIGSVLFAVFRLVGTEDQAGEIALAGERIAKQREGLEAQGSGSAQQPGWQEDDLAADGWGDGVAD